MDAFSPPEAPPVTDPGVSPALVGLIFALAAAFPGHLLSSLLLGVRYFCQPTPPHTEWVGPVGAMLIAAVSGAIAATAWARRSPDTAPRRLGMSVVVTALTAVAGCMMGTLLAEVAEGGVGRPLDVIVGGGVLGLVASAFSLPIAVVPWLVLELVVAVRAPAP